MKSSVRGRCCSIVVAVLLSTYTAAWAAPTVVAKTPAPNPSWLMGEAKRLSNAKLLAAATVMAQAAMEASRKKGGYGEYTDLEAGDLLVNLLHQQKRYDEARIAAEEQIAYWEQETASSGSKNKRDPRIPGMLGRAIEASMMAGERAEVARLQEKLFAAVNPYPGLWSLSPDEPRLRYELADFSMPLLLGQWKLTTFEPAKNRDSTTRLLYTQELADSHLSAKISLSYDEKQRKQNASQRQEWLKSYEGQGEAKALASAMPDLPFDGLTSVKHGRQEECDGEQCVNVYWMALRGDWRMAIHVTFKSRDEAQATEQVRKLFAQLKWQSARPLFRERTMAEQIQDMDSTLEIPGGWSKAAELAEKALPDAFSSEEVARVQTLIGVSQYRRGALDAARRSLDLAVPAWENGFIDEIFYRVALDYAADIAYRQGRVHEAVPLNRTFIEWQASDSTLGWAMPKNENALVNRQNGMHLPLRVGDYRLRLGTHGRFYYENLQTRAQLGLTVGFAQSSDDELESLLRSFMAKNLRLQAGDVRRTTFSPTLAKREPQTAGRKWEFDVTKLPGEKEASDEGSIDGVPRGTPIKMAFWIVDREGQRSLLRAPIMDGDQTKLEANKIAQALSW
ncbi:hypothetical protein [Pseudomonas sp.]|uniref:hypothetical protein n=1 Tax=Pseudomonas sp. TaxID=306 RepID=UPI00262EB48A|nr:hypothetical protein [Pseudomonas sp.]